MKHWPTATIAALLIFAMIFTAIAGHDKKTETKTPSDKSNGITWLSYDAGLVKAKAEDKHVFINFTTKWCGWCKKMNKTTFKEPGIIETLDAKFVSVKVDGDSKEELDIDGYRITERNLARSEFGIRSYPTYYFLKPDGGKLGAARGYQSKEQLSQYLAYVAERKYDTTKTQVHSEKGGSR